MARKRIDWLDFAHELDREREAMQERLPAGVEVYLTCSTYGSGAAFSVTLNHRAEGPEAGGWGQGRTPAKALESALADLRKKAAERARRPRLVAAEPAALPPANRTLFG